MLLIDLINSIKWPIVVVIALFLFRKPISELISEIIIKRIKYRDFEATFGREIKQLEKDAKNLPCSVQVADGVKIEEIAFTAILDRYIELAKIEPKSGLIDAWRDLEAAIYDRAKEIGISTKNPIRKIAEELCKRGILNSDEKKVFEELRELRNKAVHAGKFDLSYVDAVTYSQAAKKLAECIKKKVTS